MKKKDHGMRSIMECLVLVLKGDDQCTLADLLRWTRVVESKRRTMVNPEIASGQQPAHAQRR